MTPLLTIGIPTYNRATLLVEMLQSLVKQVDISLLPLIEIVVSDNASTDKTAEAVSEFTARNQNIQIVYHRNETNLGIDANIYAVTKLSAGIFVFIASDDDILLPGALAKIIAQIQSNPDLDAICPNFRLVSQSGREPPLPWLIFDSDRVMNNKDDILSVLSTFPTYLSCLVFRKELVVDKDYSDRVGTFLLCSYLFVDVIKAGKQALFFKEPCLLARPNNSLSYDMIQVFVSEFARVLEYARRSGFSKRAIQTVLLAHARWLAGAIRHFNKTSYRPNLKKRVGDSLKVLSLWWREPLDLLRVEVAIWRPFLPLNKLRMLFRFGRSSASQ